MRLGGPIFKQAGAPSEWADAVKASGYSAAYCPLNAKEKYPDTVVESYKKAAKDAGIVIAEVGAWSNPLSPDKKTRDDALALCKSALLLAEKIGARCAVNITGSRGKKWDGPSVLDLTEETFGMIVAYVREILDAVKPKNAFYTLETMPWMYPDSADSYLELMNAIDRKQCAVHFDPVNLISSPQRYFKNGDIIKDFVKKLGKNIKSCHAKDIILREHLTTHLDETRPGTGNLDYSVYLKEIDRLKDKDITVMLEHLPDEKEYMEGAKYIRHVAEKEGIKFI